MDKLSIDYSKVLQFVSLDEIKGLEEKANICRNQLLEKTGKGSNFVDWVRWPVTISNEEIERINLCSQRLRKNGKYLVVVGIGGSYLGAKAGIEMLESYFSDDEHEIIFTGNSFSSTETYELLAFLEKKDFSVVVISKSGTTTESAISFRLMRDLLEKKYGSQYNERVVVITTNHDSALHSMAQDFGYEEFFIPDEIGGRFSVLTAVGLLPIAFKGFSIDEILRGSKDAYNHFSSSPFMENEAMIYASIRNLLYKYDKSIEILGFYEPKMRYFGEWWKQLYGESEGKEHKGIFPASVIYSTDLHSLGQYVQDGQRNLFETIVEIRNPEKDLEVISDEKNLDQLNYLAGKKLSYINKQAMIGTSAAHFEGGVPNIIIQLEDISEYSFGYLIYLFMFACGISGYLLDVNPFNQEGVEAYKTKMFELLGKPKNLN